VKASAVEFSAQEEKLDTLWNNAGVGGANIGDYFSKQGHPNQLWTNYCGPFLFTPLLIPKLQAATKIAPKNSVRIIYGAVSDHRHPSPKRRP
jgi:NAD(P)-dependent dehydrogenase (short-subunit alcohol dehydrogenase family)